MIIGCCHSSSSIVIYLPAIGSLLTGLAAIILAYWAVNRYFKERKSEPNLSIELKNTDYVIDNNSKVYLDISLENKGIVVFRAFNRFKKIKGIIQELDYSWKDSKETVKYAIELQIKKSKQGQLVFDWFDPNHYDIVVEHINLLTDLETADLYNHYAFFMEPNEKYHFCCWLQLDKGLYEAKVIVIGQKYPDEFWHRRFPFEIK